MTTAAICPECINDKHLNCNGEALDEQNDEIVPCGCTHGTQRKIDPADYAASVVVQGHDWDPELGQYTRITITEAPDRITIHEALLKVQNERLKVAPTSGGEPAEISIHGDNLTLRYRIVSSDEYGWPQDPLGTQKVFYAEKISEEYQS